MYSEISNNKFKTWLLMVAFIAFAAVVALGFSVYVGEPMITPFVLIGMSIYVFIMYWSSSKLAMAVNGAHEIQKKDNPRLWRTIENLAITNGMPMPKVYVIDDPAPNAFATGRNPDHAIVGVTTGLLKILDDNELTGVMAHEMGHVKNYDIRVSMIAFGLVAVISLLADILIRMMWFGGSGRRDNQSNGNAVIMIIGIAAVVLAPIIAAVIQLAISRKREFLADATGALTTRYPEGLASALEKIGKHGSTMKRQHTATAHLFFANPLKGDKIKSLLSTHPPVEERVKRLRGMGSHA